MKPLSHQWKGTQSMHTRMWSVHTHACARLCTRMCAHVCMLANVQVNFARMNATVFTWWNEVMKFQTFYKEHKKSLLSVCSLPLSLLHLTECYCTNTQKTNWRSRITGNFQSSFCVPSSEAERNTQHFTDSRSNHGADYHLKWTISTCGTGHLADLGLSKQYVKVLLMLVVTGSWKMMCYLDRYTWEYRPDLTDCNKVRCMPCM